MKILEADDSKIQAVVGAIGLTDDEKELFLLLLKKLKEVRVDGQVQV